MRWAWLVLVAGAALLAAAWPSSVQQPQVFVYNWADFIGRDTLQGFERASGVHVVYDTYDSEETKETRLLAGGSGYDVVVSSTEYYAREIRAGVYRPLDRGRLSGWSNLSRHALDISARADPGNRYAVPYMHSINGFAYNVDMVRSRMPDAPTDSLDIIFRPEIAARFADCGITFLDSPEDMLQLALNYLHLDPNTDRPEDYARAEQLLKAVRPYVRAFDSSEYLSGLANGELCIAVSWSSDFAVSMARARAAGIARHLAFTVPREGSNRTYSSLLIPVDAPHPDAAYRFIDYLLRPEVIADITNSIYYGNDNAAADALVAPQIRSDPTLYPTAAMEAGLYTSDEASLAIERLRSRTWSRIKTGY